MQKDKNIDVLQVQGRMVKGYGLIPKLIMLDKRLSIEAKAIYSYFCSYAGAGTQSFPGRDKILYDLQISETRYYKHFNLLKEYGYIQVEQHVDIAGKFKNNIYTLVEMVEPYPQNECAEKKPYPQNKGTEKPYPQNPCTEKPDTENEGINIISFENNNLYNQQSCQSQIDSDMTLEFSELKENIKEEQKKEPLSYTTENDSIKSSPKTQQHIYDYNSYLKIIQDNIDYQNLLKANPHDRDLIDNIINAMLDVVCTLSSTVKINGEDKSRNLVINQYLKIGYMDVQHILNRFKEQRNKITHVHSYLKTMLYTCKQENGFYYTNAVRADGII